MYAGSISQYKVSVRISASVHAILIKTYSRGVIHSTAFSIRLRTGLTNLASYVSIKTPGYTGVRWRPLLGMQTNSVYSLIVPSFLKRLNASYIYRASFGSTKPHNLPLRITGIEVGGQVIPNVNGYTPNSGRSYIIR